MKKKRQTQYLKVASLLAVTGASAVFGDQAVKANDQVSTGADDSQLAESAAPAAVSPSETLVFETETVPAAPAASAEAVAIESPELNYSPAAAEAKSLPAGEGQPAAASQPDAAGVQVAEAQAVSELVSAPASSEAPASAAQPVSNQQDSPAAVPGQLTIKGHTHVGQTLTAEFSGGSDADAPATYQWFANTEAIPGAQGRTYTLTSSDIGKQINVEAVYQAKTGQTAKLASDYSPAVTTALAALPEIAPSADLPIVSLEGPASVKEGERATYTLRLSAPADQDISVDIRLTYESTNKDDFARFYNIRREVIKKGAQTATFRIHTLADGKVEGDEVYQVEILKAFAGTIYPDNPGQAEPVSRQSVIIPAYNYPNFRKGDDYWDAVHSVGGSQVPFVIINPSSGAGQTTDRNYAELVRRNQAAGIGNIGYISTLYGSRPLEAVKAEVLKYFELYGQDAVNGFFFDETGMASNQQTQYMAELYNYVKGISADKLVMANPGAYITDAIAPYADIFVTSEVSAATYLNQFKAAKSSFENTAANAKHIMHIVYGADESQYQQIIELSRSRNAGWLYLTSDSSMPDNNPYDDLPANFASLVSQINNLGQPENPKGGVRELPKAAALSQARKVRTVIIDADSPEEPAVLLPEEPAQAGAAALSPTEASADQEAEAPVAIISQPVANLKEDAGRLQLDGSNQVGALLTTVISDSDGVPVTGIRYQWYADGQAIAGAVHERYRVRPTDSGKVISVEAAYTDAAGNAEQISPVRLAQPILASTVQVSALGNKLYSHDQYGSYIDARDFGLMDGQTNQTAALQAALRAADAEGAALYLGPGQLKLTEQLLIGADRYQADGSLKQKGYANITALFGAGMGQTTLTFDWQQEGEYNPNTNLDNVNHWAAILIDGVDGKQVADLTLQYQPQTEADFYRTDKSYFGKINGILINDASQTVIDTVEVSGTNRAGVFFTSTATTASSRGVQSLRDQLIAGKIGEGDVPTGQGNQLLYSHLHGNRVAGALVAYQADFLAEGNHFARNGHEADGGTGYGIATMAGSYNFGVTFRRNTTDHNYRKGLDVHDGNAIVIEHNVTIGDRMHGIGVYNRQFSMDQVRITDNLIIADPDFRLAEDDGKTVVYHGYAAIQLQTNTQFMYQNLRTKGPGVFDISRNTISGLEVYRNALHTYGIEFRNHEPEIDYTLTIHDNQISGDSTKYVIGILNQTVTRQREAGKGSGTISIKGNEMNIGRTETGAIPIYVEEKLTDGKLRGSVAITDNQLTIREDAKGVVEAVQLIGNARTYEVSRNSFEIHGGINHSIISIHGRTTDAKPELLVSDNQIKTDTANLSRNWVEIGTRNGANASVTVQNNSHNDKSAPEKQVIYRPNQAPTDIRLSSAVLPGRQAGAVVGRLQAEDADAGDSHSYTVDDSRFEVADGLLKLRETESADSDTEAAVTVTVTVKDKGGLTLSKSFQLTVENPPKEPEETETPAPSDTGADSSEPTPEAAEKPSEPDAPIQPEVPALPDTPAPVQPDTPSDAEDTPAPVQEAAEKPTETDTPVQPEVPTIPDTPVPVQPEVPSDTGADSSEPTAEAAEKPSEPATPAQPVVPAEPSTPAPTPEPSEKPAETPVSGAEGQADAGEKAAEKLYLQKEAGLNLDIARHFYPAETIKAFIDSLAEKGGNFLHLHLSDNENYALESHILGQTAAEAVQNSDGSYTNPRTGKSFLSLTQLADIAHHAKLKGINLIPEIDTPAHMKGIFDLLDLKDPALSARLKASWSSQLQLDIAKEESLSFVQALLAEVTAAVGDASQHIHIGGDEFAYPARYNHEFISYVNRLQAYLASQGYKTRMYNDGLYKADLAQLNPAIEITYWSHDGAIGSYDSAERADLRLLRPTLPELLDAGFDVLNYNAYYLYTLPTAAGQAKANPSAWVSSEASDHAARQILQTWTLGHWNDQNSANVLQDTSRIKGAALSIWGETAEGLSAETIRKYTENQLAALILKTRAASDQEAQAEVAQLVKDDFANLTQASYLDIAQLAVSPEQTISLYGGGRQELSFINEELLLKQSPITLTVTGSQADAIRLGSHWQKGESKAENGHTYQAYRYQDHILWIDTDIAVLIHNSTLPVLPTAPETPAVEDPAAGEPVTSETTESTPASSETTVPEAPAAGESATSETSESEASQPTAPETPVVEEPAAAEPTEPISDPSVTEESATSETVESTQSTAPEVPTALETSDSGQAIATETAADEGITAGEAAVSEGAASANSALTEMDEAAIGAAGRPAAVQQVIPAVAAELAANPADTGSRQSAGVSAASGSASGSSLPFVPSQAFIQRPDGQLVPAQTRSRQTLPQTGDASLPYLSVLGFASLLFGGSLRRRSKRKN